MLFLTRFALINALVWLIVIHFMMENLPDPVSGKTLNDLKQVDVLGVQTPSDNSALSFELRKHDVPADCWVQYEDRYYDATAILAIDATLSEYCGEDVTEVFDSTDKSTPATRSLEARRMLAQFQIQ